MPTALEKPRIQCRHWDDQNMQCPPAALENERHCMFLLTE